MYMYILVKIIFELLGYKLSYFHYFFLFFEFSMMLMYIYLKMCNEMDFIMYLFIWCLSWIVFIVFFKILNYILLKFEKMMNWIEKSGKMKEFLLNPKVNKMMYYFMWSLPWNLPYWMYFWMMENGWYFSVWMNSNSDIMLMKYLGWDSSNLFFKLNKVLFENFFMKFFLSLKDEIMKAILRFLIIFAFFKKNLVKLNFLELVLNSMFAFCYISMFMFYFFEDMQLFNSLLFFCIVGIEVLFLFFLGYVFSFIMFSKYKYMLDIFDLKMVFFLIDPLTLDYSFVSSVFFEMNNQVWNMILGNSVSLNMLKQYMLWVNKNTKGYYFYEMNMLPKYNMVKLFEMSSMPFDMLPSTSYVMMNLRSMNNNLYKDQMMLKNSGFVMPDYSMSNMKNLYLSYFEKTYAVDSSLLSMMFLLSMNFPMNYIYLQNFYKNVMNSFCGSVMDYMMMYQKSALWSLSLAEMNKANPELFNMCYLLNSFKVEKQLYDMEYSFMIDFFGNDKEKKMPKMKEIGSMTKYKENMKLLTHFMLYEEEGIVWNENILSYLKEVEINFLNNKKINDEYLFKLNDLNKHLETFNSLKNFHDSEEELISEMEEFYVFVFNYQIDLLKIIKLSMLEIKELELNIVDIGFFNHDENLLMHCQEMMKDLESLLIDDIKNTRYFFLFED